MTTPEAAIADMLRDCAGRVQQTMTKYRGVLELRLRQVETASAISDRPGGVQNLHDTLIGYAAELDRYTGELRIDVIGFEDGCQQLRTHWLAEKQARSPAPGETHARDLTRHTENLKLARAAGETVTAAREAATTISPRPTELTRAILAHVGVLDRYLNALHLLEEISLESLARLREPRHG